MVDVSDEVGELMARGEKIAAIKLLRERTGMGLAEAKNAVERATAGAMGEVAGVPVVDAAVAAALPADVRELAARGQRIAAIRLLRQQHGVDLRTSKQRVEQAFGRAPGVGVAPIAVLIAMAIGALATWLFGR